MKLTTRLLSALLVLAMVVTMLPMPARAEETTPETIPETVPETVQETVPETTPETVPETIPELTPDTGDGSIEIPFQINPLYQGLVREADLNIPERSQLKPQQATTNATYLTIEAAGKELRKQMKNRTESFTIYVKADYYSAETVLGEMLIEALEHTGTATEGDYLMWQYGGVGGNGYRNWNSATHQYEFQLDLVAAYYTTEAQEKQVTNAVSNLISSLGVRNKSAYEKAKAVYGWICDNVTYDYENLEDTSYTLKHTAYAAIIDKTAVCQGYALLFYRMMLELGVDCRLIAGDGGGPHGWNIVEIGNLYYNVDSTWDAGAEEYSWFLLNTWNFVGHERYMEYDTMAFHNEYPMAAENYTSGGTATKDPYIAAGYCGTEENDYQNAEWWLGRDGTLTIQGEGDTYDFGYAESQRPYFAYWKDEITKVVVKKGITRLGNYSFYEFPALKTVEIAGSVKSIGKNSINGCEALEEVTLHNGVQELEGNSFARNSALTTVIFPDSLHTIGESAFSNCTSLVMTALPSGLKTLGDSAFLNCSAIKSVTIPVSLTNVGTGVFSNCESLETVTLEDGVSILPKNMFRECKKLTKVNLPSTLKTIENAAFYWCTALKNIALPEGLETIGQSAFAGTVLTSVEIPDSVTTIGSGAFQYCTSLKNVVLPKNLTVIEADVFSNCSLESIEIPAGVTEIGENAFSGTEITSLVIPEGVKRIEQYAFSECDKLTKLTLPDSLEYFSGFAKCNGLTAIVLPKNVTEIGDYALMECRGLTSITIPETVTKIGRNAFSECVNLKELDLPDGLAEIPYEMANNCQSLTEIVIPDSVTGIGAQAFRDCVNLKSITVPSAVERIEYGAFMDCSRLEKAVISGYIENEAFQYCINLKTVVLLDTVTGIGGSAFESCTALKEISMPDSVESVDSWAFSNCAGLEKASVHGDIHTRAFENCTSLKDLELQSGVQMIGSDAFLNCSALTSLIFPETVNKIAVDAFNGCSNLSMLMFQGDAPEFTYAAFRGLTATAYYPQGNETWTEEIRQNYEGNITWAAYIIPDAPVVTGSVSSNNIAVVTWEAVEGAAKYEVWRATSEDGEYTRLITTVKLTITNSPAAGGTYYYKVRALDPNGLPGEFSNVVSVTLMDKVPVISGELNSKNRAVITWGEVFGATKYEVWRATSENGTYRRLITTTKLSCINSPKAGVYYYKVRAVKANGTKTAYSNVVCVTVYDPIPVITGRVNSKNKAVIQWAPVKDAVKYEVYRSTTGETGTFKRLITTKNLYTINSPAGGTYYYKVRAIKEDGTKTVFSNVASLTVMDSVPVITGELNSKNRAVITWEPVFGAVKYEVWRSDSENGTYRRLITTTKLNCINSPAAGTYYYKVRAVKEDGTKTAYSNVVCVTVK